MRKQLQSTEKAVEMLITAEQPVTQDKRTYTYDQLIQLVHVLKTQ